MLSVQWYGYVARCMRECLTLSFLRLVLYLVWFFLLVLCLLRIWCKRLSTRLFRISYSREESQINRGKITARSTNDDQYRGTNCHEIAACFGTQFWNRAKHRFRNRTKFMRNLEKRHFLTSWPVPDPDLEIKSGGGGGEVRVRVRATQVCAGMVWFLSTPSWHGVSFFPLLVLHSRCDP